MEVNSGMNKARELKKKYGDHYLFRKHLTDRQIARLKSVPPDPFPDTVATSLEVGCMRLDAVLFRSPSGLELGYDILVKDAPNSREWIFYDAGLSRQPEGNGDGGRTRPIYHRAWSLLY